MRDISSKIKTLRVATAKATLTAEPETITHIREGTAPKGDPLPVAKVAAIQAAKNTSQIIPYCHPLPVDAVDVHFVVLDNAIEVFVTIKVIYKTGVEMEAMTAASVAALTLYDMLKMLDETMEITGVELLSKHGGKSDFKQGIASQLSAAVVVISDSVSEGTKPDRSGQVILERLKLENFGSIDYNIVSDDPEAISGIINQLARQQGIDLIITTGGTGLSPRDNTPEVMELLIEREIPGMAEVMRQYGQERTPYAMLSRSKSGLIGKTMVLNLPGSTGGVTDSLDALFPAVLHGFKILRGGGHTPAKQASDRVPEFAH